MKNKISFTNLLRALLFSLVVFVTVPAQAVETTCVYGSRGSQKETVIPADSGPYLEYCFLGNEACTIRDLWNLHGSEWTWHQTFGNGHFGTLSQMGQIGLINCNLANGLIHGYSFKVAIINQTPNFPASFKINATPQIYGTTGKRSFLITEYGVILGADKNGEPADENDPPIEL